MAWSQAIHDEMRVVGQTPLRTGVKVDEIASNAQSVTDEDLREQRSLDFAEFMHRNIAGVFVNEAQNNPLQPDVQYRGFVGSPLLGLPQGIAVYLAGVRVNEPFGDTVNWALIPQSAIDTAYLVPGSNPLFGQLLAGSSFFLRGDDGNDTVKIGDHAVLNFRAEYRLRDTAQWFLIVDDVLNAEYETFGAFGQADEVPGNDFDDPRFLSPTAPIGAWIGLQMSF